MLAINSESFDDITPHEVFGNIITHINEKQKPSEKVIECVFDKCCDYYVKTYNNDRLLAGCLISFYDFLSKTDGLNEKYLRKIFDIIQKNTSIDFDAMSEYKLVKNIHDYQIFLDKFDG